MAITPVSDHFCVSPQIAPADIAALAQAGFRSIICNRPDHEGPDQPAFATIEAAARAAGLQARHIPVVPGQITEAHGQAMRTALAELPGPVLAYCRSGARSTSLWQAAQSLA